MAETALELAVGEVGVAFELARKYFPEAFGAQLGKPVRNSVDGMRAIVEGYHKSPTAFACVEKISNDIASPSYFGIRVVHENDTRAVRDGKSQVVKAGERFQNADGTYHPLERLLNTQATPEFSARRYRKSLIQRALPFTYAAAIVIRDATGKVIALVPWLDGEVRPIRPASVAAGYDKDGIPRRYAAFAFYSRHKATGKDAPVLVKDASEVVWIEYGDPESSSKTISPLWGAAAAIDTEIYLLGCLRGIFKNDGMATTVIKLPTSDRTTIEAFKAELRARNEDPDRKGEALVAGSSEGNGLEVERTGFKPGDLDLPASTGLIDKLILRPFGMPPSQLGETSAETFSNGAAAALQYISSCLDPHLGALIDAHQHLLEPGLRLEWDLTGIPALQENEDAVVKRLTDMLDRGLITRNEVRAKLGYDPLEGEYEEAGEALTVFGMGYGELNHILNPPAPQILGPDGKPLGFDPATGAPVLPEAPEAETDEPDEDDEPLALSPASKSVDVVEVREKFVPAPTAKPNAYARGLARVGDAHAVPVQAAVNAYLLRQRTRLTSALRARAKSLPSPDNAALAALVSGLFNVDQWDKELTTDAPGWLLPAMKAGMGHAQDSLPEGADHPLSDDQLGELAANQSKDLTVINETTANKLREVMSKGMEYGWDGDTLAGLVSNALGFEEGSDQSSRALLIGANEAHKAMGSASYATLSLSDAVSGFRWTTMGDEKVRKTHTDLEGEEQPVGEPFSNGCLYPRDPDGDPDETVNCRCQLEPIFGLGGPHA